VSPSRLSVGAAAAFFASMLSLGPAPSAGPILPERAGAATPALPAPDALPALSPSQHEGAWPPPGVREIAAPVPDDVRVHAEPLAHGGVRIRVERRGYLVALRHGAASNAGRDWAAIELRASPGAGGGATSAERGGGALPRAWLVWEATHLERMETARGLVHLDPAARAGGDASSAAVSARLTLAEPPGRGRALHGAKAHACASHGDGGGGFVVLCRLGREARAARAVNLTGPRPLEGAWLVEAKGRDRGAVVRLELPRSGALAEARAVTYVRGLEGVVLRAEAMWPPDGEPTLLLDEARRAQPSL
jgi:hypothetical protein